MISLKIENFDLKNCHTQDLIVNKSTDFKSHYVHQKDQQLKRFGYQFYEYNAHIVNNFM